MSLVKIAYISRTGNTEGISKVLEEKFSENGAEVVRAAAKDIDGDFFDDADICVVATYTFGHGEVPAGFTDFEKAIADKDYSGKIFGVVGSGNLEHHADTFAHAAEIFDTVMNNTGAKRGHTLVKINGAASDDDMPVLSEFADDLVAVKVK